ncbi:MAG: hypothetical protein WBN18_12060 [Flavobacteriaceae bacterium]
MATFLDLVLILNLCFAGVTIMVIGYGLYASKIKSILGGYRNLRSQN